MKLALKEIFVRRKDLHLIRSIRGGGMASLFLARGPDDGLYVIRELNRDLLFNLRLRRGFINGLRLRRALSPHPYILETRGIRTHCSVPYEVVDFISGGNLNELINKRHEKVRNHHLDILRQVAAGLAHMHSLHIVHLDLKAENILVDADSDLHNVHVRLTDFDLSRYMHFIRGRLRSGTARYMAPEQLSGGRVGYESDMFAFGVLAYYLVSGRMPFSGFSAEQARQMQADPRRRAEPVGGLCSGLTSRLEEVIMECLEKEPEKRFPTMAYLEHELRRI